MVGEELGGGGEIEYWLVDPLDGTVNFLHGFPIVATSVALVAGGRPVAGAVHGPYLETTFPPPVARALSRTGAHWPSRTPCRSVPWWDRVPLQAPGAAQEYLRVFLPALERFEDLRRPGAMALDLAWVAAGVVEGFFELGFSPWDVAAGALLVQKAGGVSPTGRAAPATSPETSWPATAPSTTPWSSWRRLGNSHSGPLTGSSRRPMLRFVSEGVSEGRRTM